MRIANNSTALFIHHQYNLHNNQIAKSAMRLSSGYRINSAADDPAGLAISEKMRAQIRGLNMAARNCEDAISLVQTAEGALAETHAILQRMRELAIQAASDTNDDYTDRAALDAEYQQLLEELADIASQTRFNGRPLLDGSVDAETGKSVGFLWGITSADPADVAAISAGLQISTTGMKLNVSASVTFAAAEDETAPGAEDAQSARLTITDGVNTYYVYAGAQGGADGAEFTAGTYDIVDASGRVKGKAVMNAAAASAIGNANATDGMQIISMPEAHGGLIIQAGANSGDTLMISIRSMSPGRLGLTGSGVSTREAASAATDLLDRAIQAVSTERGRLGGLQNRLEHKINNLNTQAENLTAAESRIRDVDMAKEMMAYTKARIQAQVATAMLAQANSAPENVLTLLRSL